VAGLAIGMAGAILIFQLVSYHLGVDRYHRNAARTYRVVVDLHLEDGSVEKEKGSAFILHQTLKKDFAYVENAAYIARNEITVDAGQGGKSRKFLEKQNAVFSNTDFFKIFDYEWLEGSSSVLNEPKKAVITERYARKYFGNTAAVGKSIRINNKEDVVIAGIVKDYPEQTDQKYDLFISLPTIKQVIPEYGYADWGWIDSNRETYITLRSAEDKAAFEKQMPAFSRKYYGADSKVFHYHLVDLADLHFDIAYGGKIKYSTIAVLSAVGFLLILIACFNFINLSTAQAFRRSKEVGVRKVLGVSRSQVFWLFMHETALFTTISAVIALILAKLFIPFLGDWLNIALRIDLTGDLKLVAFGALLIFSVIILAGVYPALLIAKFNPVRAMKGLLRQNENSFFSVRKGLVVAQFSISFVLIAVAMVIILQSRYMRSKDLGMNKDLILHINLPESKTSKTNVLRNEILQLKEAINISFFHSPPASQSGGGGSIKFENRDWEKFVGRSKVADENYVSTYGLRLVAGRNMIASDTVRELLVNEKMVKMLGLKSPEEALNKTLLIGDIGLPGTISGVLADFNNADLYKEIEPTVIYPTRKYYRRAAIKLNGLNANTVSNIAAIWQKQFPDEVFQYDFFDEEIARFYEREELASRLISVFAILSVFLSCLGLFGLALFSIQQRTKEIGVRKVLGASVSSITALLSMDFLRLVIVSVIISCPVAWYFMHQWLQDFAFRIEITWWIFALSGLIAVGIALLTVSYQSIKAALMDPVRSLRSE
jgi:putative ABC transport system permease protein